MGHDTLRRIRDFTLDTGCEILLIQCSIYMSVVSLDFDLSMSLEVKSASAVGLPIYAFLLVFQSNMLTYALSRFLCDI